MAIALQEVNLSHTGPEMEQMRKDYRATRREVALALGISEQTLWVYESKHRVEDGLYNEVLTICQRLQEERTKKYNE